MLTSAAVKAARPRDRAYKMADERGLFLFVATTGTCSYRLKFRFQRREKLLVLGRHPEISLTEARARAEAAREQLGRGEDPCAARRRGDHPVAGNDMVELTFMSTARAWHEQRRPRWSDEHAGDVIESLELHVFPAIGDKRLDEIDPPAILQLLQRVEAAGTFETARRLRQRISMIFSYAIARKLVDADPAAILSRELGAAPAAKPQLALLELDEVRELYAAIAAIETPAIAVLAARFLALTGVRLAAVRGAAWEEFTDIDWAGDFIGPLRPSWTIPARRMKLTAAKKLDPKHAHVVTLSRQAVDLLRAARQLAGDAATRSALVFPGRGNNRQLGESAIGELHARAGYSGRHVPHGWRASFSTVMNDRYPDDQGAIDRALAHAPKDKVEAAYNRAQHLARRRWLLQRWADLIAPTAAG